MSENLQNFQINHPLSILSPKSQTPDYFKSSTQNTNLNTIEFKGNTNYESRSNLNSFNCIKYKLISANEDSIILKKIKTIQVNACIFY